MKTVSFVIPIYNEEKRLEKTIRALLDGFNFRGIKLSEVIFVDDGSDDRTKLRIKSSELRIEKVLKATVRIISYKTNRGKGYAVKKGMLASTADYTLMFDADMSTPLSEFSKFASLLKRDNDVIIGTRKNSHSTVVVAQPLYRQLMGRAFTMLANILLSTDVTDFTCGFKLFSRKATDTIFKKGRIDRWGYDAEILFIAKKAGLDVKEVPVLWLNDKRTKVHLIKDTFISLRELLEIRNNNLHGLYFEKPGYIKKIWNFS